MRNEEFPPIVKGGWVAFLIPHSKFLIPYYASLCLSSRDDLNPLLLSLYSLLDEVARIEQRYLCAVEIVRP